MLMSVSCGPIDEYTFTSSSMKTRWEERRAAALFHIFKPLSTKDHNFEILRNKNLWRFRFHVEKVIIERKTLKSYQYSSFKSGLQLLLCW